MIGTPPPHPDGDKPSPDEVPTEPTALRGLDPRLVSAWQEWLRALATDADAAIAAAHVYRSLDAPARDAFLDAVTEDAPNLAVPAVAIFAPLLAAESDPDRRARIERAITDDTGAHLSAHPIRVLRGVARDGARVLAVVSPLYLRFVDVLFCRYFDDAGFVWVRHDALVADEDAPVAGALLDGVALEETPLEPVIEELAHAVLAHRRRGEDLPPALQLFAHLFDAHLPDEP